MNKIFQEEYGSGITLAEPFIIHIRKDLIKFIIVKSVYFTNIAVK